MHDRKSFTVFKTALGWSGAAVSELGVTKIVLPRKEEKSAVRELSRAERGLLSSNTAIAFSILEKTAALLKKCFSGGPVSFDLPLDMRYYTVFQQAVWQATAAIPYGETRTYSWVAKRINNPKAVRAVGQALGANPLPIIIPCHRVISSAGTLGGFSGGIGMKQKLLELEIKCK